MTVVANRILGAKVEGAEALLTFRDIYSQYGAKTNEGANAGNPSFMLDGPTATDLTAGTFTRATARSTTDYQGNVLQLLSGEIPWQGYRRVRNEAPQASEDATTWSYVSNVTVSDYQTFSFNTSDGRFGQYFAAPTGSVYIIQCELKDAGAGRTVALRDSNSNSTPKVVTLTTSWQKVWMVATVNAGSIYPSVVNAVASGGDGLTGSIMVRKLMAERARPGQTAPSEYVSKGVLSAPYHGAGVDGVKWFDTDENGRKINGTVGYSMSGGAWVEDASATPVAPGIDFDTLSTNTLPYSEAFTSWTNLNGADALAADSSVWAPNKRGYPDKFTSNAGTIGGLRVNAAGMTNGATHTYAVKVKDGDARYVYLRSTGVAGGGAFDTGTAIFDLQSGAVTYTGSEITEATISQVLPVSEGYWQCEITFDADDPKPYDLIDIGIWGGPDFADTSPTAGVYVYFATAQNETGSRATSYIYTNGSATARNADTFALTALPNYATQNEGSFLLDFVPMAETAAYVNYLAGQTWLFKNNGVDTLTQTDGSGTLTFGTQVLGTRTKVASKWKVGTNRVGYKDAVDAFNGTYDGAWSGSTLTINGPMLLRNLSIWPSALTAAQLQGVTS